ncbi:uncharacterized protein LOC113141323 [Mastacembelus armatus]|uniref:Uncharacterized LOC113141323 n=1 Tax=Mastacembelus armatus TaxID=205130 RepID=A0A3Q3NF00_9TELE|nr:uncharacterized protein LOC113141323 [Mastacembelus armatus]
MMKVSGRLTVCCVALLFLLTSECAIQRLNSINDLKKINFGQSVPKHSLLLLHWFANTVSIDNNNVIWLTFDPNNRDYGSHHYRNAEGLLDPLPQGSRYYTVGNLHLNSSEELPHYVFYPVMEYDGSNRDRIIFRVRQQNTGFQTWQRIERVYITQHYDTSEHQGTAYDPLYTYQVTTNLLREIQEFSVAQVQQNSLSELRDHFGSNADESELWNIRNTWGDLATLGLLLFIVTQEKYSSNQRKKRSQPASRRKAQPDVVINIPNTGQNSIDASETFERLLPDQTSMIKLEVMTGTNGKARISWSNIPRHRRKGHMMVVLFKNNEDWEVLAKELIGDRESGSCQTSIPLNNGLQARLHEGKNWYCFWKVGEEICRGSEFNNPKAVQIAGYNAWLQLFVKDGKASARLYVEKSFHEWRFEFNKSWVAFYTSENKATNEYEWWKWQWATKFKPSPDCKDEYYDIYEYHSGMAIVPGVQARFILSERDVKALTPSWR